MMKQSFAILPAALILLSPRLIFADPPERPPRFIRGDVDMNFSLDLGDVSDLLGYLYFDNPERLDCEAAADWNIDGQVDLGDVLATLFYLFAAGSPPNLPYPTCGEDPAPTGLSCESYWVCATGKLTNSRGMHLLPVSAGEFLMGSPLDERGRFDDEIPHTVILTCDFYMTATEITQAQYFAVMGQNPSSYQATTEEELQVRPVNQVDWSHAADFCERLSALEGQGRLYRLPYEAEWEYACRAGTTTRFWFGDNLQCPDDACACPEASPYMWNYCTDKNPDPPVGMKEPNPWGFYDMHEHLNEWCQDWYGRYSVGPVINPTGPSSGKYKVIRGWEHLGFDVTFREVRAARRRWDVTNDQGPSYGFRVVLELPTCPYND
jgi:formylglycine-generating enzyme required for sulfatase activity